jgi:hypothetical protein
MNSEIGRKFFQELGRIFPVGVKIDPDDNKALSAVLILHLIQPGERATARAAPGRPEVQDYDFSMELAETKGG